ncbi:MAG: hypothetical protein FJW35_16615, partial [Acidobacteria bacterium]|nr:hypothetical protein [Acidobacteriota bacterium]
MSDVDVPIGESIAFGWRATWDNFWSWFLVVIVGGLVGWIPIVGSLIHAGFVRITLNVYDGGEPEVGSLFSEWRVWLRMFFGTILYALVVLAGLILLIIPGIYWAVKYIYVPYFIVDKDLGILESFSASGELTQGAKLELFLLWILLGLINMLGALCCGVGLLVTIPTTLMALAFVYRGLQGGISPVEIERTSHVVQP